MVSLFLISMSRDNRSVTFASHFLQKENKILRKAFILSSASAAERWIRPSFTLHYHPLLFVWPRCLGGDPSCQVSCALDMKCVCCKGRS